MKLNNERRLLGFSLVNPHGRRQHGKPYRQYHVVRYHSTIEFCIAVDDYPAVPRAIWSFEELFAEYTGERNFVPCAIERTESL